MHIIENGVGWKSGVGCNKCELNVYFFKNGVNVSHGIKGSTRAIREAWNRRANP